MRCRNVGAVVFLGELGALYSMSFAVVNTSYNLKLNTNADACGIDIPGILIVKSAHFLMRISHVTRVFGCSALVI